MTNARIVFIVIILLMTPVAVAFEESEQPVVTEAEFSLEFEILEAAAAGIDSIVFPRATYLCTNTIVLSDLSGMDIFFEYGSKILLDDVNKDVIQLKDCENIDISGGYFSHVEPLDSQNCHGCVFRLRRCNYISFDYCEIRGCGMIGIHAGECSGLNVTNCKIKDNSICAFFLYDIDGLYIADCEITDNGELFSPNGSISGLWMIGNTIKDNGYPYYP